MNTDFVDLGLSSRWATCNLGADSPEEYGDYYAWGETKPKDYYAGSNYQWLSHNMNAKYGIANEYAKDNPSVKTTLDIEDDIAHLLLGNKWRIPNINDIGELFERCLWTKTTRRKVKGYKVTSLVEGYTDRSIFLPYAGFMIQSMLVNPGFSGYYWSSVLYKSNAKYAISTVFDQEIRIRFLPYYRYHGFSIRPVCD